MPSTRRELVGLHRYPVPQAGRYQCLRLDKNENIVGFPAAFIRKMLRDVSPHFLAAYPEPGPLYDKLAKLHRVKRENLCLTAGSEMAIRYLFEAYLDRGDEVIFLDPSFAMFDVYARLCGAKPVTVTCDRSLRFSAKELIGKMGKRTKLVAIANPNNPTGTVFTEKEVLSILRAAKLRDILVLMDEAYFYFYPESALKFLPRFRNLVVTRTFSKACGLASIRLGYAIGHPSVIAEVAKLQPIDHANAFALKLGEYLLDHEDAIWDYVDKVERGKRLVEGVVRKLGLTSPPSRGNFLLIDLGDQALKARLIRRANQEKVLLGTHIRLPFENTFVRITLGPEKEMRRFVKLLKETIRGDV